MAIPARCCKCRARRNLSKRPELYSILPACRTCGGRKYYVDEYRFKKERKKISRNTCNCKELRFPHRRGCKMCWHSPSYFEDWGEVYEDYA